MINPTAAPFFLLSIIKNFSASDKKLVEKIYKKLCEFELKAISLDLRYDEKGEAEFIRTSVKQWNELQDDLKELSSLIGKAWDASFEKKDRSYFG
jgi:hypothetical protein